MHKKYKPIKFPTDESAHDYTVEWWYFNGHLQDEAGREYSFMDCLFKVDVKKIKMPFWSKVIGTSYFSHSLLSDLHRREFNHHISPVSVISDDSFSKPLLYINYINPDMKRGYLNCLVEETEPRKYHIKNEDIDLVLTSTKKPLLEGGKGYLDLRSNKGYYYSLTNLRTEGRIKVGSEWLEVAGKSWMDHQWADTKYSLGRWDWFCVQLEGDIEIICYMYESDKGRVYEADISFADGSQEHYKKMEIIPAGEYWTSPKSQASYPTSWKIKIPARDIELDLVSRMEDQEMLFGSINYWEGPLTVSGRWGGKKVQGLGFMELVGYPSQYNNLKFVRDEIRSGASRFILSLKNKLVK